MISLKPERYLDVLSPDFAVGIVSFRDVRIVFPVKILLLRHVGQIGTTWSR
jgi:hypothetical protein